MITLQGERKENKREKKRKRRKEKMGKGNLDDFKFSFLYVYKSLPPYILILKILKVSFFRVTFRLC